MELKEGPAGIRKFAPTRSGCGGLRDEDLEAPSGDPTCSAIKSLDPITSCHRPGKGKAGQLRDMLSDSIFPIVISKPGMISEVTAKDPS